jgi:hypothetical protein
MVLQVALIKQFNDKSCKISQAGFSRDDLPDKIKLETGIRMKLSQRCPALSAIGFIRKQSILNNDLIRCPITNETRKSRDYLQRQRGAFGPVAAHNTVIEPQLGGRLHWHKTLYFSALTPTLMNRMAAGPDKLINCVANMMNSISCTNVSDSCRDWFNQIEEEEKKANENGETKPHRPRAADIPVPSAKQSYSEFVEAGMKKAVLTNTHVHGFSCEKGKTGAYMCRLALPRGHNEELTTPLLVKGTFDHGDMSKGVRPVLETEKVQESEELKNKLDKSHNPLNGELTRPHLNGPIIWEMHRPEKDNMFVEPNLIASNLLQCHNNAAIITGKDSGECVEEYTAQYMTKEGAPLRQATAVLLAATSHIAKYKSHAEDSGEIDRTGKHLAQRTLNAFVGSHQWSLPLMVYALHGFKSFTTTESFIYIFPHDNVSYYKKHCNTVADEDLEIDIEDTTSETDTDTDTDIYSDSHLIRNLQPKEKKENYETAPTKIVIVAHDESCHTPPPVNAPNSNHNTNTPPEKTQQVSIDEFLAQIDDEEHDKSKERIGATVYKVGDKCIFLTQADSYVNRGKHFKQYSQLEFECIVEIKPKEKKRKVKRNSKAGRKPRKSFELGPNHPLFASHHAFIRIKMRTAMLGGRPPPTFPGNQKSDPPDAEWSSDMDDYAAYVMNFMVPWTNMCKPIFSFDTKGFANLLNQWDRRIETLVNRQRFRIIDNLLSKTNRNSRNEQLATWWRNRCAQFWSELGHQDGGHNGTNLPTDEHNGHHKAKAADGTRNHGNEEVDNEAEGNLSYMELLKLTSTAAANIDEARAENIRKLRETCLHLHGTGTNDKPKFPSTQDQVAITEMPVVYRHSYSGVENGISSTLNAITQEGEGHVDIPRMGHRLTLKEIKNEIREMQAIDNLQENEKLHEPDQHAPSNAGPPEVKDMLDASTIMEQLDTYSTSNGSHLTADQCRIVKIILQAVKEDKQALLFLHSGGGTGKSTVVHALYELLQLHGFSQANTCPTGVGATLLDNGKTFHSLFRAYMTDLNASSTIDEIKKELGGDRLRLVVIDEVSMLKSTFLLLLHRRLQSMYKPNKLFGGVCVLILGDFLQLPTVRANALYRVMYGNVNEQDAHVRALFQKFRVIELEKQLRAGECEIQQRRLKSFRALPLKYPAFGSHWSAEDKKNYHPMTEDMIDGLTAELTREEVLADERWTTDATCLTTTNLDRSIINNIVAKIYGAKKRQTVVRWTRQFRKAFDLTVKEFMETLLYSEDRYPELFGYFVHGAPSQILDNGNGNVAYGVANGTSCKMISLAWDDPVKEQEMYTLTSAATEKHIIEGEDSCETTKVIDLPYPPDYIIVEVVVKDASKWPSHLNLSPDPGRIHIPIGTKTNRQCDNKEKIFLANNQALSYHVHAVDLSFAITTWKSQGGTFEYIIALLENYGGSSKQKLSYELLYVMFSRVKKAQRFRCMPLSAPLDLRNRLRKLYPNLYAIKYRMDINDDGYWDPKHSEQQMMDKDNKSKLHRNRPKAALAKEQARQQNHATDGLNHTEKECILLTTLDFVPPMQKAPTDTFIVIDGNDKHQPIKFYTIKEGKAALVTPSSNTFEDTIKTPSGTANDPVDLSLTPDDLFITAITRQDELDRALDSLLPTTGWLTDSIIDWHMRMIIEQHGNPNIKCLSPQFYLHLTRPTFSYERVFRWIDNIRLFSSRQFALETSKLLIPINYNGYHWVLAFIDFQQKHFGYYDSFQCPRPTISQTLTQLVRAMHQHYHPNVAFPESQWSNHSLHTSIEGPQQTNGYDCGLFVSLAARHLLTHKDLQSAPFCQANLSNLRRVIADEIIEWRQQQLCLFEAS